MPVSMSVLAQTAGPQRVSRVMSVLGVPMLLGPVLGPVIGGLIVGGASWRLIFYVNVPIAVVALALGRRILRDNTGRADAGRLDWTGVGLLCPGMAGVVFGLSQIESGGGLGRPIALVPMLCGALLVALFALHALRVSRPLLDVRLFRRGHFSAAAGTTFLTGAAMFGAMLLLPLYYQEARGQDALAAGLLMSPQGIGAALALPIAGRLADRFGGGRVVLGGCVVSALATIPLVAIDANTPSVVLHAAIFARGLGVGATMMPAMAAAYARLTTAQVPRATSALNALQRIGGSIGTALLAVVLQHGMRAGIEPAHAFAHAFAWALGLALLCLVPASVLAWSERDRARADGSVSRPATAAAGPSTSIS